MAEESGLADGQGAVAPVTKAARVESLDILRGIAVFGILAMNITAFGLLFQAYGNPTVAGGAEGSNLLAYKIINVGFEGTMRGIFSLLFGAGIVLLTERMEQAGAGIMAAEIHFRRMLWMMLFGVIHWTLLLWTGEILFAYSLCGLVLFSFRKLAPRRLLTIGGALLLVATVMSYSGYLSIAETKEAATAAMAAEAAGTKLTTEQQEAVEGWKEALGHWAPTPENAAQQEAWHSGSYLDAVGGQLPGSFEFQWDGLPFFFFFDMVPFMLIGMALLKLGVLGAQRSMRFYLGMVVAGYAVGIPLGFYEMNLVVASSFDLVASRQSDTTYEISRLAMVIGHLGLLLAFIKAGPFKAFQRGMAAVGTMALSNYLMQTIICTWLFYSFGPGLGLFGQLERHQLYYVVGGIWVAEFIWSVIWLKYFRFGPFEWLWRSLTYWERQPMKL
ncbi:MAG: hypothetical protein RL339_1088 [Pseudomonadota bacterium]|jgi:uncharacterized protein